jgi:hypothetical protein
LLGGAVREALRIDPAPRAPLDAVVADSLGRVERFRDVAVGEGPV